MRSSWGCVQRMSKGVYRIRYVTHDAAGKAHRHSETVRGSRQDADRRLAELRLGMGAAKDSPTVSEVRERHYWPDCVERLRPNTLKNKRVAWGVVERTWGDVPVHKVRTVDVQDWADTLSGSNAKVIVQELRMIMERAVLFGYIDRNPVISAIRADSSVIAPKSKRVLTLAELNEYVSTTRGSVCEVPAILQAFGGCRVGESIAVAVGEVEREGNVAVIVVSRQLDRFGDMAPLKTRTSRRVVAIPEPWATRLLELQDAAREAGKAWLCEEGAGLTYSQYAVTTSWANCVRSAGLDPLPMRNLRNSYETMMHWELGVPLDRASKLMGHATVTTTEKHYDRPDTGAVVRVVADAWDYLGHAGVAQ